MQVTLAKTLKLRKRLVEKITRTGEAIKRSNCILVGGTRDVTDILGALAERKRLVAFLVKLKSALSQANQPIQETIFRMAELKAEITFLREISTARGKHIVGEYMNRAVQEYEAILGQSDIDKMTWALQLQVDDLQEQLDQFNHAHTVDVQDDLLEALGPE